MKKFSFLKIKMFIPFIIEDITNNEQLKIISKEIIQVQFDVVKNLLLGVSAIILILMLLLLVAYTILLERKLLASIQRRRGPNYVGFMGLLQPIADAIKLIIKETIIPVAANRIIFLIAPLIALILSLLN